MKSVTKWQLMKIVVINFKTKYFLQYGTAKALRTYNKLSKREIFKPLNSDFWAVQPLILEGGVWIGQKCIWN